jgi:hypothetical protein
VYGGGVPNLTIYVPQALAAELAKHDVPISATCQTALWRKIRARGRHGSAAITAARSQGHEHPAGRAS